MDINENIDQLDYNLFIERYPNAQFDLVPAAGMYLHPNIKGSTNNPEVSLKFYIAIAIPESGEREDYFNPKKSSFVDTS